MFMQSNPIHISTLEAPLPLPNVAPLAIHNSYPQHAQGVPPGVLRSGRYAVRFARSAENLRDVQRLRFAVFNLELHEGLTESYATGLDQDAFDLRCHHLMVCDEATGTWSYPRPLERLWPGIGRADGLTAAFTGRDAATFTAIANARPSPVSLRHAAACRHAVSSTAAPMGTSRPVSSATAMNCAGASMPCCGCCQRNKASKPVTAAVSKPMTGW